MGRVFKSIVILLIITLISVPVASQVTKSEAEEMNCFLTGLDETEDFYLLHLYDLYLNGESDKIDLYKADHIRKSYIANHSKNGLIATETLIAEVYKQRGDTANAMAHLKAANIANQERAKDTDLSLFGRNIIIWILATALALAIAMLIISYVRRGTIITDKTRIEESSAEIEDKYNGMMADLVAKSQIEKEQIIYSFLSTNSDADTLHKALLDIIEQKKAALTPETLLTLLMICTGKDTDDICTRFSYSSSSYYRIRRDIFKIISAEKDATREEIIKATAKYIARL